MNHRAQTTTHMNVDDVEDHNISSEKASLFVLTRSTSVIPSHAALKLHVTLKRQCVNNIVKRTIISTVLNHVMYSRGVVPIPSEQVRYLRRFYNVIFSVPFYF